jgi:Domain of unknown function (DUF4160)
MPKLSYFHGITITMHWDEPHHHTPHFHALFGEHEASLDLEGEIIAGELPKRHYASYKPGSSSTPRSCTQIGSSPPMKSH